MKGSNAVTRVRTDEPGIDRRHLLGAAAAAAVIGGAHQADAAATGNASLGRLRDRSHETRYRTIGVDGLTIFFREAGDSTRPAILLLHGFPSSSHMFRDLIPLLSREFHLIAPDYPGFGHSDAPAPADFDYSFDHLADVIEGFVDAVGLERFGLYVQDYGAPVGFRLATRRPEQIDALIVQNGNAYDEGLTDFARPLATFGAAPRTAESEQPFRDQLTLEGTIFQYVEGVRDPELISPDAWTMDYHFLDRPGNDEIQLTLFHDYLSNVALYPEWHAYFRDRQPPALIVWGKNDPIFGAPGAEAYRQDLPDAEIHLLDTGHFALEDHAEEIADRIARFYAAQVTDS
jgi:pimeloyl-ACP methyl ester carboxylesterase